MKYKEFRGHSTTRVTICANSVTAFYGSGNVCFRLSCTLREENEIAKGLDLCEIKCSKKWLCYMVFDCFYFFIHFISVCLQCVAQFYPMYGEHLCFIFVVFIECTLLLIIIMNCVSFVEKLRNWKRFIVFNTSCVFRWCYVKVNFLFMTSFIWWSSIDR